MSNAVSYVWVVIHSVPEEEILNIVGVYTSEVKAMEAQHDFYCDIFYDDEITVEDHDGSVTVQQVPLL